MKRHHLMLLLVTAWLGALSPVTAWAAGCSPYRGQVFINELRIGASGNSSTRNQIELYNPGNVPQAVWQTWQLVVYSQRSGRAPSKRGGYYLSSGFTANGQFLYNSNKRIYLSNRSGRYADVALVDANGDFIDYVAVENRIQSVPACLGATPVVDATSSRNASGDIPRLPDGGPWPAAVVNTSSHTIGYSNTCTSSGRDLVVAAAVDITSPTVNDTPVTYTVTVFNKSCSLAVNSIEIKITNITATYFSGLAYAMTTGSVESQTGYIVWKGFNLAAGAGATLTITGTPRVLGSLTTTASVLNPSSGLVNTADDADSETINVRDHNYVGFDLLADTLTEGLTTTYTATLSSDLAASRPITVSYTVSGTADAGDTDLSASGSVVIDPGDADAPTQAEISFTVTNDAVHEPTKTLLLRITGISTSDPDVRLDTAARDMTLTLLDDDPAFVTPGGFNAFETAAPAGAIAGNIHTKVAGQAFNLDVVVLNGAATAVNTAFTGDIGIELVNAVAAACASHPTVGTGGGVTFAAGDGGRKTVSFAGDGNVWRDLRVRMKYPATTPSVIACSGDNFAIRPASLAAYAGDGDWASPGTARTLNAATAGGAPYHKAGRPFSLVATAYNAGGNPTANYNGTPTAGVTGCVLPASGCVPGTLTAGTFSGSGTVSSTTASYSEAGAITATLSDATFAAVDAADGSTPAERTVTSAAFTIGRFVPDHFDLAANSPAFLPACGGFTYLGQPFGFGNPPTWTVTARNAAGGTTQNYAGGLWKLTGAGVTGQTWTAAAGTLQMVGSLPAPGVTSLGGGSGSIVFAVGDPAAGGGLRFARAALAAPFSASLNLAAGVADSEGVSYTANPYTQTGIGFDDGNAGTGNDAEMRFGRLRLANAYGSERLALPVPLTAQYWNGQGFVINTADQCTTLPALAPVALTAPLAPGLTFYPATAQNHLAAGETTAGLASPLVAGSAALVLSAPGPDNFGYLDVVADAPAWLDYNWDGVDQGGDGQLFDDNPRARTAFGKRRGSDSVIFRRETY